MNPLDKLPIPLLAWYEDNKRDLPWRREVNPYRVWVSEIMLQQTRVAAVLDYYERFMGAFPTIEALAEAQEDKLLKLWQGLGYYSRVRNLKRAAVQIIERFDGTFPENYEDIRSLAGIGDYTAAAIASIAFGLAYPAVDGNLLRVCARVTGDHDDITSPAMKRKVTTALTEIIPARQPGAFNQAMMDLGSSICLPNGTPLCRLCPANEFCVARAKNQVELLPVRGKKKARRVEQRTVFLFFHQGCVALRKRGDTGLLAGLWEYPCVPEGGASTFLAGLRLPEHGEHVGSARHLFTHIEWRMQAYCFHLPQKHLPESWVWADADALRETYALPSAFSAFATIVESNLNACGNQKK